MKPLVLLVALLALMAASVHAGDAEQLELQALPQQHLDAATPHLELAPRLRLEAARAMEAEIRAMMQAQLEAEEMAVANLKTASPAEREAIAKHASEAAAQLHLDILQVQLRYAQAAGLDQQVEMLQTKIALRLEAQERPTHVAADLLGKNDRQPSIPTLPDVRPMNKSGENGFSEGGEQK